MPCWITWRVKRGQKRFNLLLQGQVVIRVEKVWRDRRCRVGCIPEDLYVQVGAG